MVLILLEVLHEQGAQLLDLTLEVGGAVPALSRVEQLVRNVGAALGDRQVEGLVSLELDVCELAGVDSVEDGASVLERAALAWSLSVDFLFRCVGVLLTTSGSTGTNPTGVEEPGVGTVLLDLLGEHSGVAHGVKRKEGLGEARGESSLGLGDTLLGTGHLRGVTRDEVVHGLLGVELGDGRKDTAGVAGEENDVLGVAVRLAGDLGVLDVLDGVGAASVLGQGVVIVVDNTGDRVENNVLEDGTELDGVENIGLLLCGETNGLSVATTLDVEDTCVRPAVLVVTDERTLGVSRQGGLAGTGQTEEDGNIAVLALVGGRVKGEDVVLDGHFVEENCEDTLIVRVSAGPCCWLQIIKPIEG